MKACRWSDRLSRMSVAISWLGVLGVLGLAGLAGFWNAKYFSLSALSFLAFLSYSNYFRFFFAAPQVGEAERGLICLPALGLFAASGMWLMKAYPWAGFIGFLGFLGFLGLRMGSKPSLRWTN